MEKIEQPAEATSTEAEAPTPEEPKAPEQIKGVDVLTPEQVKELEEGKTERMKLQFNIVRPETVVNMVSLGGNTLCFCWVPDPEKPDEYGGLAVNNARVAAEISHKFAQMADALMKKEAEFAVKNATLPARRVPRAKGFKGRLK